MPSLRLTVSMHSFPFRGHYALTSSHCVYEPLFILLSLCTHRISLRLCTPPFICQCAPTSSYRNYATLHSPVPMHSTHCVYAPLCILLIYLTPSIPLPICTHFDSLWLCTPVQIISLPHPSPFLCLFALTSCYCVYMHPSPAYLFSISKTPRNLSISMPIRTPPYPTP